MNQIFDTLIVCVCACGGGGGGGGGGVFLQRHRPGQVPAQPAAEVDGRARPRDALPLARLRRMGGRRRGPRLQK